MTKIIFKNKFMKFYIVKNVLKKYIANNVRFFGQINQIMINYQIIYAINKINTLILII